MLWKLSAKLSMHNNYHLVTFIFHYGDGRCGISFLFPFWCIWCFPMNKVQARKAAINKVPEQIILSEVRRMVDEMKALNKKLEETVSCIIREKYKIGKFRISIQVFLLDLSVLFSLEKLYQLALRTSVWNVPFSLLLLMSKLDD